MSRSKAINETAKITKIMKIAKKQELQNFARPATKIDAEMQMSRWKAINETAKITRITKFCSANNENRRRNANESMEGHQRKSENYKNHENCENNKHYKILQGQ